MPNDFIDLLDCALQGRFHEYDNLFDKIVQERCAPQGRLLSDLMAGTIKEVLQRDGVPEDDPEYSLDNGQEMYGDTLYTDVKYLTELMKSLYLSLSRFRKSRLGQPQYDYDVTFEGDEDATEELIESKIDRLKQIGFRNICSTEYMAVATCLHECDELIPPYFMQNMRIDGSVGLHSSQVGEFIENLVLLLESMEDKSVPLYVCEKILIDRNAAFLKNASSEDLDKLCEAVGKQFFGRKFEMGGIMRADLDLQTTHLGSRHATRSEIFKLEVLNEHDIEIFNKAFQFVKALKSLSIIQKLPFDSVEVDDPALEVAKTVLLLKEHPDLFATLNEDQLLAAFHSVSPPSFEDYMEIEDDDSLAAEAADTDNVQRLQTLSRASLFLCKELKNKSPDHPIFQQDRKRSGDEEDYGPADTKRKKEKHYGTVILAETTEPAPSPKNITINHLLASEECIEIV
jgi:hypothetical protein